MRTLSSNLFHEKDEKIRYYNQVVRYRLHEKDYLGVSKCYHAILHTPSVEAVEEKWIEVNSFWP